MQPYLNYPLSIFLEIEPFVKEYYGIDRYAITDIVMQSVDLKELKKNMETTLERPRYDVDCAFQLIDSIKFNLYDNCKYKEVVELCGNYNIAPNSFAYNVLIFMSLVPSVNSDFPMGAAEDANQDFMEYAVAVRPEMLKLYIALHQLNKDRSFHKSCHIRFGEGKEVEVDKVVPWFQMEIERYLEKYLGERNLKEAELEYLNVYGKKIGKPIDKNTASYIWGTYHLLQKVDTLKSSNLQSVTNKQARFILDYLSLFKLVNPIDVTYNNIRGRLNNFLKNYDTLEEVLEVIHYKSSPNNKDGLTYYYDSFKSTLH